MDGLRQLVVVLLWLLLPRPALAHACEEAVLMLIHPAVASAYQPVIDQLAEGLAETAGQSIAVCALKALNAGSWSRPPGQVVAVGASAYSAAERAFPQARVLPILVERPPGRARDGFSRFIDPALLLQGLRSIAPKTETLYFIHHREVPAAFLARAQGAADALGLRWTAIGVGDLREAALAIERVRREAGPTSAVWFHRDVLALNPDILVPPIVRRSWEVGFPVISDDADTVERGLLFALTPDYRAIGRAAAMQLGQPRSGLVDLRWVHRVLNPRTARALGLAVRPSEETGFDAPDE
ncbi:hypothetical protein [Thiorhodococcus minor]|uniref:ABC transporter substrate-binding protein n=1 Tax=Thiorhodococcus minor TaxID=57489 RepID=A0A6M0JVR5_9GAMM|nr:hypothetical protein [Thiorhodococcus minor]NEV61626.1 hypothetical protein [Thiorhodococcus minor]